mmetsp:Transcript_11168/g.27266  ORF Transcript_11168/g.27266 Transcript_11168/m.27266 type:complete len:314 (-) Transcript_11168:242-1183(-)
MGGVREAAPRDGDDAPLGRGHLATRRKLCVERRVRAREPSDGDRRERHRRDGFPLSIHHRRRRAVGSVNNGLVARPRPRRQILEVKVYLESGERRGSDRRGAVRWRGEGQRAHSAPTPARTQCAVEQSHLVHVPVEIAGGHQRPEPVLRPHREGGAGERGEDGVERSGDPVHVQHSSAVCARGAARVEVRATVRYHERHRHMVPLPGRNWRGGHGDGGQGRVGVRKVRAIPRQGRRRLPCSVAQAHHRGTPSRRGLPGGGAHPRGQGEHASLGVVEGSRAQVRLVRVRGVQIRAARSGYGRHLRRRQQQREET